MPLAFRPQQTLKAEINVRAVLVITGYAFSILVTSEKLEKTENYFPHPIPILSSI